MAYYVDTSALVKLVSAELETPALRSWLAQGRELVSSDLARAELARAVRRAAPERMAQARAVLDSLTLVSLPGATFEAAGRLPPDIWRTLDALHLAAALELGDDLDGIVTYDSRLAAAARAQGIAVLAPGAPADLGTGSPGSMT
ncbi:MAG: PIN domain-containing protein [Bifidobacteriaceae bacterium]|jgi:predicted nucleic acid-binding protein|nr:PIN domain-containing protein [Bifidobacteriaceae bacterium]